MAAHVKEYRDLLETVMPNIDIAIEKAKQKQVLEQNYSYDMYKHLRRPEEQT